VRLYRVAPRLRLDATHVRYGEIPHCLTQRHVYKLVVEHGMASADIRRRSYA
jgi:hypothetical protein